MSGLREIRAFLYSLLNGDNTYVKLDIYNKESELSTKLIISLTICY